MVLDLSIPAWWLEHAPRQERLCYRRKADALNAFRERNADVFGSWRMDAEATGGEFDAINEKYGLRGKRRVRTLAQAIWAAMPAGAPYCLDKLDVDALNDTRPCVEGGGCALPDYVEEHKLWTKAERAEWFGVSPARVGWAVLGIMAGMGALGLLVIVARRR